MRTQLNNCPTCANNNAWLNILTSNNVKFNYVEKKQVKIIEAKAIEVKSKDALLTNFNNFYCGPEKKGNVSSIKTLSNHLGIKREDKISFKTDYISTSKETLYNGFHLSISLDENDVRLVIKEDITNLKSWIVCWNISRIASFMKKKNPSITESNVRTLLLNGSLKVKFNVSEIKDHGTLWKVSKK